MGLQLSVKNTACVHFLLLREIVPNTSRVMDNRQLPRDSAH